MVAPFLSEQKKQKNFWYPPSSISLTWLLFINDDDDDNDNADDGDGDDNDDGDGEDDDDDDDDNSDAHQSVVAEPRLNNK